MNDKRGRGALAPRSPMRPLVRRRRRRPRPHGQPVARPHAALGVPGPQARRGLRGLAADDRWRRPHLPGRWPARWPAPAWPRSSPGSWIGATSTSIASTSANVTEDLLEARGARFFQVDPEHVDDAELWRQRLLPLLRPRGGRGRLRRHGGLHAWLLRVAGGAVAGPATLPGARFMHEFGRWLDGQGLGGTDRRHLLPPPRAAVRAGRARRAAGRGLSHSARQGPGRRLLRRLRRSRCGSWPATCRPAPAPRPSSSAAACRRTSSRSPPPA